MISKTRRSLLITMAAAPFITACAPLFNAQDFQQERFAALEAQHGGRLGVAAINTADGVTLKYRADERFPFCSTFKVLVAAAALKRSEHDATLLQKRVHFARKDIVSYSPITEKHLAHGMTVAELCAAALQYSDNTAGNLLMEMAGGPAGVTAFARSLGDQKTRIDRWETALNTGIPGDPRDTTTPLEMARNLEHLTVKNALNVEAREQLKNWMLGNTTGATRIRSGVPENWRVADKTGTGDYGTTNDIGVLWPPNKPPLIVAIYFTQKDQNAKANNEVIASAARIIAAI